MKIEEVIAFLDREAKKGTLKGATATAMKAACSKIQDFLEDKENDVEWLMENLDIVFARVTNKDASLNQTSVKTYQSRALRALSLYKNSQENPLNWHKELRHRKHRKQSGVRENGEIKVKDESSRPEFTSGVNDISLPFRDNFDFKARLPKDATMKEIWILCHHLMLLAKDFDPTKVRPDWFSGSGGRAKPSREIE